MANIWQDLEKVFVVDGQKYVVEFEATFDGLDTYIDILRIEAIGQGFIDEQVLFEAQKVAHKAAEELRPESVYT